MRSVSPANAPRGTFAGEHGRSLDRAHTSECGCVSIAGVSPCRSIVHVLFPSHSSRLPTGMAHRSLIAVVFVRLALAIGFSIAGCLPCGESRSCGSKPWRPGRLIFSPDLAPARLAPLPCGIQRMRSSGSAFRLGTHYGTDIRRCQQLFSEQGQPAASPRRACGHHPPVRACMIRAHVRA